eukprot:TRINITY_DN627_c2_g1_i1.p1 TRINITY_DN627_c2_g1~~TRINITY_DN627_c2_g1_i1.p1  ORF type:complete len:326 (+),score=95.65 TRINITY_DN627_c2_g1_i1:79-1056(+)
MPSSTEEVIEEGGGGAGTNDDGGGVGGDGGGTSPEQSSKPPSLTRAIARAPFFWKTDEELDALENINVLDQFREETPTLCQVCCHFAFHGKVWALKQALVLRKKSDETDDVGQVNTNDSDSTSTNIGNNSDIENEGAGVKPERKSLLAYFESIAPKFLPERKKGDHRQLDHSLIDGCRFSPSNSVKIPDEFDVVSTVEGERHTIRASVADDVVGATPLQACVIGDGLSNKNYFSDSKKTAVGLIEDLNMDLNEVNSRNGFTALHYACKFCRLDQADILLEHGASTDIVSSVGKTALEESPAWCVEAMRERFDRISPEATATVDKR